MNRALPTFEEAESRNKLSHFTVQGFDLNGVLHGGTNDGEEIYNYMRFGIQHVWGFEPLRSAFQLCKQNCAAWAAELGWGGELELANYALSDWEGEDKLKVTAGDGKGSSLFFPDMNHPEVKKNWTEGQAVIERVETCAVITLPAWLAKHPKFDTANYDTLVLDTQGNEYEILQGMGELIKGFKYLCIELSINPAFKGETTGEVVEKYLTKQGFTLDSPRYDHNDWFFVRSDIKPESDQSYRGRC